MENAIYDTVSAMGYPDARQMTMDFLVEQDIQHHAAGSFYSADLCARCRPVILPDHSRSLLESVAASVPTGSHATVILRRACPDSFTTEVCIGDVRLSFSVQGVDLDSAMDATGVVIYGVPSRALASLAGRKAERCADIVRFDHNSGSPLAFHADFFREGGMPPAPPAPEHTARRFALRHIAHMLPVLRGRGFCTISSNGVFAAFSGDCAAILRPPASNVLSPDYLLMVAPKQIAATVEHCPDANMVVARNSIYIESGSNAPFAVSAILAGDSPPDVAPVADRLRLASMNILCSLADSRELPDSAPASSRIPGFHISDGFLVVCDGITRTRYAPPANVRLPSPFSTRVPRSLAGALTPFTGLPGIVYMYPISGSGLPAGIEACGAEFWAFPARSKACHLAVA